MSIFDNIRNPFNQAFPEGSLFSIPEGKFVTAPDPWKSTVNKSQAMTLAQQTELMRSIYDTPPLTKERYTAVVHYLKLCCSAFCRVVYDPETDDHPTVIWTDVESDMGWFADLVTKMTTKTKEEVESQSDNVIFEKFMDAFNKENADIIELDSLSKVTD